MIKSKTKQKNKRLLSTKRSKIQQKKVIEQLIEQLITQEEQNIKKRKEK